MLLQTLCHRYRLTLPCACWQMIKDPYSKTCRPPFAFGSWARGTSAQLPDAKYSYLFKRGAKSAQGRNGINGGHPRSGELAVYAGFGLEQTQRSARRVELTMPPFAIKLSEEPKKVAGAVSAKQMKRVFHWFRPETCDVLASNSCDLQS